MTPIRAKNRALDHRPSIEFVPVTAAPTDQPAPADPEVASPAPRFEAPGTGPVSKLFQYASLFERRRQIQGLLAEIHPPELRLGRRSRRELERDPFVQALERVEAPVRKQLAALLRDRIDSPLGLTELKSLYESPHLETFFRKYSEVREELLRQNPSYLRQRSLEAAIVRLGGEAEPAELPSRDTLEWIREDLAAEISDLEADEESRRLAEAEFSADLGDGESDEPIEPVEAPPSPELKAARQKLALFESLLEEWAMTDCDPDLEGIARDMAAYEEEWLWKQLESRLAAVESLDGEHPRVREFQAALEELRENPAATVQDYQAVLAQAERAALWTAVEARIDLYTEMHDSAATTDAIINLTKTALGFDGELIDGASAYLDMQTRYIAAHRALIEGREDEARKLFLRLEASTEQAGLLQGYRDSQRINQCTVTAAIVTASAATAGIAAELVGGAALALGMTRGLSLLKFGSHAAAFTVAERGYGAWLQGESFFDPGMSFSENLGQLGWETALNAGMFAFLGRAFHAFEKRVILPLARSRALAKVGADEARLSPALLGAERQALLDRWTTGIPLRLGKFGAELLAFGQWEAIALNLELNRENLRKGRGLELSLPLAALFSLAAWEERFVFLVALKAGGLLAAPIAKPLQQGLMAWLPQPARAPAATEPSPAEAPRQTLRPEDYLDSLSGKNPIGSGGMMQAFEFSKNPDQILLLPNDAWWEGREIGSGNPEFDRVHLRETLENYERLAPLRYRGRPLAPRIDGLLEDSHGQILGFLMERVPGENLHELIEAGKISARQMSAIEARLREQLEILHDLGLSHGDPEFRNVHVRFGEGGELLDARFLDFTRPKPDRYEPTHGTPAYDWEIFGEELKQTTTALRGFGGGHDGPLKPKAEDVAKFVELYESGDEIAGLRGLVELAEQGLAQAVLEMLVLKLGPGTGDRLKIHEALASVRPAALADRAPEEYPALRALLELAASGNEAAQSTLATVSLAALRKALTLPPEAEGSSASFNLDLGDCLFYGNPEAEEILFGEHRHQIHPEHLAQWEEKILREGRLNYPKLSPERLLELAREGRKDILFGLLEMAKDRSNPTIRGLLDFLFYEETAGVLIERIRWLRGEMGPTTLLDHDLQSTPADHVRRIAQFAPHRADAQRALLELANAGHPEARRALSAPPLDGTFEDGQELSLFVAEAPAFGMTAWKYLGLDGIRPTFEKVRMHDSEPPASLRLLEIEGSLTRLKVGTHYYFLEKNDADPTEPRGDPSPFSLPFMIFGPDSLLRRGLDWLWQKIGAGEKPEAADRFTTLESSPAEGWALDEAGRHYFDHPRRLQLTDQPSEFAERKYGRWRLLDLQVWRGRSLLLLEKQGPMPDRIYFETSEPLRRAIREDGQIFLIGKETLLPVDADFYFFPVISGGSDGSGFAFGRLGSAAARGLLLKDFSGWKGRFRLYQIERREADGLGQEVLVLKPADGGGTEELRFQVEAGDAGQAHTGWKTGDYLYFIADSAKGLSAHPEDRPPGESFSEIYRNWRNSQAAESRRRIAQRMFAAKPPEVPTNSHIPEPTVLRETGGGEYLLKTRRVDEAEYDVRYSAILIGHEVEAGDPYREAAQVRLSFGLFETIEDFRHFKEHGFPRRSFTFLATRAEATRLGFEYDAAGNLLSQSREKNWILKESGRAAALRGEWQVSPSVPEPQPLPLPAEYRLFDSGAAEGSAVMLGRGAAPAGFEDAFLSIEDPVVRRRHLLIRRGAENKVEIQAIPPDRRLSEGRNRQAFWVESGEDWLPLPANLPYVLKPGERFALGQVNRQGQTSQALVFRLSADGNSLILD